MGWTRRDIGVTVLLAMDEHRKQAGQRLVQLRDAKGWSQEDLAREAEVSTKTVSRFENGRHDGRRSTVRQIAAALGVDEADLIGPPPDPLGLGEPSQLDRIEAALGELRDQVAQLAAENKQLRARLATEALGRAGKRKAAADRASGEGQPRKGRPRERPANGG